MSHFSNLIQKYRDVAKTQREKGNYFEQLCIKYFQNEPCYAELFKNVQTYTEWAHSQDLPGNDAGIDLIATTFDGEFHAIQCKLYEEDAKIPKSEIDSFLSAASKRYFSRRYIISTSRNWSENALNTLQNQDPPVTKINLETLENSSIDWSKFEEKKEIVLKKKKELYPYQETH